MARARFGQVLNLKIGVLVKTLKEVEKDWVCRRRLCVESYLVDMGDVGA